MATISGVARPAYVYDAANNQWVPIGVGPHTHSLADLPSVVSTNGGSTIVNQAPTVKPLVIQGASGQTENLFEIQNSAGTATYTYSSAGNIGIGTTNITGRVSISGPNPTTNLTIEAYNDSTKRHIIQADNDILRLFGTWTGGTPGGQIAFNTGGATGGERLRIDASGNVRIGDLVEPDTLRYFDIYNRNTGSNAGAIIRFITNNATSSAVTTVDMVKYKNGNFVIANNDTTGNAHLFYNSGGVNAFVVNPAGNMGIQLRNQTSPTPSNQASLEVNTTGSGLTSAWFKNFAGSQASPTEVADWPNPVVAITAVGNYFRQTMLRFSLPNDNLWQTDNASWNFKLNGVTATGWDNNGNTTPKITSDADLGLELIGPGNLRMGNQNARSVIFHTNSIDRGCFNGTGSFLVGTLTNLNNEVIGSRATANTQNLWLDSTDPNYSTVVFGNRVTRANTSVYNFLQNWSSAGGDVEHYMRGDGQAYADGSWNGGGADYAEYFEWADGNPDSEDRRGYSVSLVNEKIKIADEGETVIGVVSGNPSVVGDDAPSKWAGKYLKDDFGTYIRNEEGYRVLNPDYDEELEYVSRENRPEWSTIGLMGKLRIRKGQVTGPNWIKMRDISATVEEWLVR